MHLSGRPNASAAGRFSQSSCSGTRFVPQDLRSRSRGMAQCNRPTIGDDVRAVGRGRRCEIARPASLLDPTPLARTRVRTGCS